MLVLHARANGRDILSFNPNTNEVPMTKHALAILLLSTLTWAADPNPADYTITVHVTVSRLVFEAGAANQELNVTIDGKKFELRSGPVNGLLALGDYKAKLVKDEHKTTYDSSQTYELVFADRKTRRFEMVGQSE
jgi:hypothetical protein